MISSETIAMKTTSTKTLLSFNEDHCDEDDFVGDYCDEVHFDEDHLVEVSSDEDHVDEECRQGPLWT